MSRDQIKRDKSNQSTIRRNVRIRQILWHPRRGRPLPPALVLSTHRSGTGGRETDSGAKTVLDDRSAYDGDARRSDRKWHAYGKGGGEGGPGGRPAGDAVYKKMDTRDGEQFNTTAAGAGPTRRNPIRTPRARAPVCVCVCVRVHGEYARFTLRRRPTADGRPGGVGLRGEIAGGAGNAATGNVVVWRVRRGIRHRSSVTRARVSTAVISPPLPGISKIVSFFPYVNRVGESRACPSSSSFSGFSLVGRRIHGGHPAPLNATRSAFAVQRRRQSSADGTK